MKIAYICSDVDIQLMGGQGCSVHIREFTNALVDAGHDVFIICAWLGEATHLQTKARVYHLEPQGFDQRLWEHLSTDPIVLNNHLERDIRSILWNTWLQIQGAQIFEREQPDFIYERYALFGYGAEQLSRRFQIPRILELNAPLCDQQKGYEKFPLIETARRLEPQILRHADAIVALTQWLADWATNYGVPSEKIVVLPDAVSARLFSAEIDRHSVRQELNLSHQEVVGFVGSFHKWHDVSGLIDAFAILVPERPNLRLLLVGDGHDRKKLQKKVRELGLADLVIFTGNVPHHDVPKYIAAMDVAVVPYQPIDDFFFSPMKLFESMAVGCATVAADLGQMSQVVEHGTTGWLYPPGQNKMLAQGIEKLLQDRPLAKRMGNAARDYVLNRHTWEKVTQSIVEIAQKLLVADSSMEKVVTS